LALHQLGVLQRQAAHWFFVTARESGTLDFEWIDDVGARGTAQAAVKVV
jgi:hypothetical protein